MLFDAGRLNMCPEPKVPALPLPSPAYVSRLVSSAM
jgi:hypothetical protein